jgi:hypothetical protein
MATSKKAGAKKKVAATKSPKKKTKRNTLSKLEAVTANEIERNRKISTRPRTSTKKGISGRTKAAHDARRGRGRKPVKMPKGKSAAEIKKMDPDDPSFKHPQGRPRKYNYDEDIDTSEMSVAEIGRIEKQRGSNKIRAKVRKREAVLEKTAEEEYPRGNNQPVSRVEGESMYAEDLLIADGKVDLDDWDSEELIRGYRRNRAGKFDPPPKFIPREIMTEAFRRLVRIGERKLRQKYLEIIDELINLATDPNVSDKVRLDAIKEIQNRVVGKTPDVVVTTEAPWQDMLVDSVVPIDEAIPLDVRGTVVSTSPIPRLSSGDGVSSAPTAATATPAKQKKKAPSPEGRGRQSGNGKQKVTVPAAKRIPAEADWEDDE